MIGRNEILTYFVISLFSFMLIVSNAYIFTEPDLSVPKRKKLTTTTTTTNTKSETRTYNRGSSFDQIPNIMLYLIIILAIAGIFLVVGRIHSYSKSNRLDKKTKTKSEKESVFKLKSAREEAYAVLQNSLETKEYTSSFIKAYQVLDTNLEYFRDVVRPKYYTPKEYSYSVRSPIFRPSVFNFVKIFYRLRYGKQEAIRDDILNFISALNNLFVDEISNTLRDKLLMEFTQEVGDQTIYTVPRIFDPTKPRGGKL